MNVEVMTPFLPHVHCADKTKAEQGKCSISASDLLASGEHYGNWGDTGGNTKDTRQTLLT